MDWGLLATWVVGIGGFLTGIAAVFRTRSQNRMDDTTSETLDRKALTEAVGTVQAVYGKLTGDLREQVDDLIQRDKECTEELRKMKIRLHELAVEIEGLKAGQP